MTRACGTIRIALIRGRREEYVTLYGDGHAELWEFDGYNDILDVYKLKRRDARELREMMERARTREDFQRIVKFVLDRGELVDCW